MLHYLRISIFLIYTYGKLVFLKQKDKLLVTRWISSGDLTYSMVTTVNTVLCTWTLIREYILNVLTTHTNGNYVKWWMRKLTLLWLSFHHVYTIHTSSVQNVSIYVIWKIETFFWRRYKKHCTQDSDASVPFQVGTLGPHTVLPLTISGPFWFSWISLMVWNLFPFKGDFSLGKSQKSQGTKSGL